MSACAFCGASLPADLKVLRVSECSSCGRDLHACVQCRHYDPNAHNKCREPQAEWVTDRERRNFCEYFVLSSAGRAGGAGDRSRSARSSLDKLFGPKEPPPE